MSASCYQQNTENFEYNIAKNKNSMDNLMSVVRCTSKWKMPFLTQFCDCNTRMKVNREAKNHFFYRFAETSSQVGRNKTRDCAIHEQVTIFIGTCANLQGGLCAMSKAPDDKCRSS